MSENEAKRVEQPLSRRQILKTGVAGLTAATSVAFANTMNPTASPAEQNPSGRFSGKVVVITGATSGIGEATARAFAAEGATVHFCGRRAQLGERVAQSIRDAGGRATYQRADVRVPEEVRGFVETAVSEYGRVDIAFNNAGVFMPPLELQDLTVAQYLDLIDTNLNGVAYAMMHQIPVMREQGGGVIVNMASVAGHRGFGNTPHYNASKHGVIGLTKAVAVANAAHNIRVNSFSPLAVDTPMLRESLRFQEITLEDAAAANVTPRIMQPVEMARAVMFLADDSSTMISGMDLDVTGGQLA